MPVTGEGRRKILVIAEAPGEQEDKCNVQLIGPAGQLLRNHLKDIGVDLDRDCWKTNAVICLPERDKDGNRKPTNSQIEACRSNVFKTIRETNPETIILMGGIAVQSVIGWLWKESPGKIGRWVGWQIPCQKLNAWVCPTHHPSYINRMKNDRKIGGVLGLWFKRHLELAFGLEGRPWETVPDFAKEVKVVIDVEEAEKMIHHWFVNESSPVAFDYECNMLKPDSDEAEIVCVSMSNGNLVLAFPMHGKAVPAFREFLKSPVPKIAHNMKFEDRWSRAVLKTNVRNWDWCTMQNAHVLDNRPGITGLKFQSFVMLGQSSYDDTVTPFLKGGSNTPNKIRQADIRDVLLYCGMDSVLTWNIAEKQRRMIG
jgi:uracil-DNA glycosylase family 4